MNKIIGTIFIIIGLILIGIGTYGEIEEINKTTISQDNSNYHDGLYITSGDSMTVVSQSENVIDVVLNNIGYQFIYNGKYYEDKNSGFYIMFNGEELTLYKDGEMIRTLYKK